MRTSKSERAHTPRRSPAVKPSRIPSSTDPFDLLPESGCGAALHELIRDPAGAAIDFIVVAANPGYAQILHLDRAAVVGRRASAALPADDLRRWLGLLDGATAPDPEPRFVLGPTVAGRTVHGFVNVTGQGLVATVFADATEHRGSGERIAHSQAELAAIYENAPILMCVLDGERRVLRANRAFSDLVDVPEHELLGGRACGVFGCLDADDDPRGCGFAPTCAECMLRQAIDDTAATGIRHTHVEHRVTLRSRQGMRQHVFLGSTVRLAMEAGPEILVSLLDITERVRAEQALAASEERLALATAASSEAVWEWPDLDADRFWWSPRFHELLGYAPGELEPTLATFMELVHPDDRVRIGREVVERINSTLPFESEYRLRTKSGDYRWISARGVMSPRHADKPAGMIGTIRDITDRRQAEEDLRRSEQIHKTVVENSPDIIARFDRDFRHRFVSPAVTAATGLPTGRFIGKTNRELGMSGDNVALWESALGGAFATGQVRSIEFESPSPDGIRCFSSLLIPEHDADGSIASVLSIARDVTLEKQARRALALEEHRHRLLLDTLQEGILAFDGEGTIVYANAPASRLIGLGREALCGKSLAAIMATEGAESSAAILARWLAAPGGHGECTLARVDGSRLDAEIRAGRLLASPGAPAGVIVSVLDITDRRRSAKELEGSQEKLRSLARHLLSAREEERRKVAQEIHDELGQVLTGLIMDLRWLAQRLEAAPSAIQAKIREMIDLSDRTIRMVQRICSELRPRMLDDLGLGPALEWLAGDFQRRLGIACAAEVDLRSSRIGGNAATSLFRIVQEVLTNVARHAHAHRVHIRLQEMDDVLSLDIDDDGIGISEAAATAPRSFGLIGLRERVQELDGDFAIGGETGRGTRISITIPFPGGGGLA